MAAVASSQPETGWLPTTRVEDNLLRRFVHSQAVVNSITATALGGRTDHNDDVFLAYTGGPIPYLNQAILTRPLEGAHDAALGTVEAFFDDAYLAGRPATLLSLWPTPDLSTKGWSLVGHPALVLRAPGASVHEPAPGVTVRKATAPENFATAERVAVEGYPFEQARGLPTGSLLPPALAGTDPIVRLGQLDGETVAVGNVVIAHGLVPDVHGWATVLGVRGNQSTRPQRLISGVDQRVEPRLHRPGSFQPGRSRARSVRNRRSAGKVTDDRRSDRITHITGASGQWGRRRVQR